MATAYGASGTTTPGRSARAGRKRDGIPWHSPLTQVVKGHCTGFLDGWNYPQATGTRPARRIRHNLRRDDDIGRIAFKPESQAEVQTGGEGMDIGIIRNGQQQADGLGLQRPVEVDGLPLERLALAAFLPEA